MAAPTALLFCVGLLGPLAVSGEMTAAPVYQLSALTAEGAKLLVEELQRGTKALNEAAAQWNSAVARCEAVQEAKKQPCVDCVKRRCVDKAKACGKQLTFSGVINSITDLGTSAISSISNVGKAIVDTGKKVISSVGKVFKGWGRRRRGAEARAAEPSCSEFGSQASTAAACQKYTAFCSACQFNPITDCPGYANAKKVVDTTNQHWGWIRKIGSDKNYQISSASYDPASFNPESTSYSRVWVSVSIFGRQTRFYVSKPVPFFQANVAGRIVANEALQWFKDNA